MNTFTFSFIIPVKPGRCVAALESLRRLEVPSEIFEVMVVEGCSPSLQRNSAAQEAGGDILYFLDDDSLVSPDCIATCTSVMGDSNVAAVGGPSLTPASDSTMQQLFGLALSTLFGAGVMRNRYRAVGEVRETTDKELILCNLAMRRSIFLASGGLDERLYPNEENELLDRVLVSGKKLIHAPELAIRRSQRRSVRLFIRQMFSYGRGRAQQTLIAGYGPLIGFIPLLFLFYLALLPLAALNLLFLLPLFLYSVLNIVFTAAAMFSSGSASALLLPFIFPLMHISNGCGLLYGLVGGKNGKKAPPDSTITVKHLKQFGQQDW